MVTPPYSVSFAAVSVWTGIAPINSQAAERLGYPEPPGFAQLWQAYQRSYVYLGNDPIIGRRLVSLLVEAGAVPVRNALVFFGSCSGEPKFFYYVAKLIGVIYGARPVILEAGLLEAERFDRAMEAIRDWSCDKNAALWYAVASAAGMKLKRPTD